nr:glycoside hydrolase family 3 protein [Bacteroidota bacterium]
MTNILKLFITGLLLLPCQGFLSAQQPNYKNPNLPVVERVADLISRMTLEEKVAQLTSFHPRRPKLDEVFLNDPAKMDSMFGNGAGMMNPSFNRELQATAELRNKLQNYLKTQTRLGIPVIFLDEGHHGLMRPGVNVFPQAIGLVCSWDPALAEELYNYIAREVSAWGTNMVLSPVVDICRDPRWGRTGETFGEDPYLCGIMGSALVKGFQGSDDGSIAPDHVAATLKHLVAYGEPEGGINQSTGNFSTRILREFHMESFRMCIENAKPSSVMSSYNEIDGIPSHANRWLLKDILRDE